MRIAPINLDRIRRHRLGMGPAPAYRATRLIHKDVLLVEGQKFQRSWWEAVPHKGPATITALEEGDCVRMTIAFDPV